MLRTQCDLKLKLPGATLAMVPPNVLFAMSVKSGAQPPLCEKCIYCALVINPLGFTATSFSFQKCLDMFCIVKFAFCINAVPLSVTCFDE